MVYSFAGCVLDAGRHVLTRDGRAVPVEPQVFDLLFCLAENAGTLVTKDQLVEAVWNGRIVSEATISGRINAARAAVGDSGRDQKIIRTVPRRGFEMVAEVSIDAPERPRPAEASQTVRYAASADGTNIAWSEAGGGSPLLYAWHHLSHLEQDWESRLLGPGLRRLAGHHRLIRFDVRGAGLSDRVRPGDTLDSHVEDMAAVADAAGLDRFPVVAVLQATAVAIRFAARYPGRVSRLVLINPYARGRALRENAPEVSELDPFIALLGSGGWGDPANGFMRAWATMVLPMATPEDTTELIELIATASTTEDALVQRHLIDHLDIREDLAAVKAPTLVIHARLCAIHPATEGRRVAAGIADAEFLEVDTSNTFPIASDPTFDRIHKVFLDFLARDRAVGGT
jgi:DNA-binding winged helix-turn-helix (wHTH) protein